MEVSGRLNAPAALFPRKEPQGSHKIWGQVNSRASLDIMEKMKVGCVCRESKRDSLSVHPEPVFTITDAKWNGTSESHAQWSAAFITLLSRSRVIEDGFWIGNWMF
jgi:hypothetical protein